MLFARARSLPLTAPATGQNGHFWGIKCAILSLSNGASIEKRADVQESRVHAMLRFPDERFPRSELLMRDDVPVVV